MFMSSWLGTSLLSLGELIIKTMPLMSYIYSASKQISAAISPGQGSHAFKEVAIMSHPSVGEYALGFITSTVILQMVISGGMSICETHRCILFCSISVKNQLFTPTQLSICSQFINPEGRSAGPWFLQQPCYNIGLLKFYCKSLPNIETS